MSIKKVLLLAGLLPTGAAPALAGPPKPTGQKVYGQLCARCHGRDGRAGLNGAHDLTRSTLNAMGRTYIVQNGLGKMPAFKAELTPAEVQQVVEYSLTLK